MEKTYADLIESARKIELEKKPRARKVSDKNVETSSASTRISDIEEIKFTSDDIEPFIGIPLDAYFLREGKDKLNDSERKNLSIATANLFNKYFPSVSKWKEECAFIIALGAILLPRIEFKQAPEPPIIDKKIDEATTVTTAT